MKNRPTPTAYQAGVLARARERSGANIIGIDEVGYGAVAGPLVVAGVLSHKWWDHELARDSKTMTPKQRSRGYELFVNDPKVAVEAIFIASLDAHQLDVLGVYEARRFLTLHVASTMYRTYPESIVFLDGDDVVSVPEVPPAHLYYLPKADALVPVTSAASVVAKAFRDNDMDQFSEVFPEYKLNSNKGYLTADHEAGLRAQGPSPIHRFSYPRVREYMVDSSVWRSRQQQTEISAWTSWLRQ